MGQALDIASRALASGDVPVGALVFSPEGEVLGVGHNLREGKGDPTAHAEVIAIRAAATAWGQWRLENCTLVVTVTTRVQFSSRHCPHAVAAARMAITSACAVGSPLPSRRLCPTPRTSPSGENTRAPTGTSPDASAREAMSRAWPIHASYRSSNVRRAAPGGSITR